MTSDERKTLESLAENTERHSGPLVNSISLADADDATGQMECAAAIRAALAEVDALTQQVEAARRVIEAVDTCDREAERDPASQSSAPMVRYINAVAALRAALIAAKEAP